MIDDIYKRTKILGKACIKIALVLPNDKALALLMRNYLVDGAAKMSVKAKGLMSTQVQDIFIKNLSEAKEAADACNYWLEFVKEENMIDSHIIDPILVESSEICKLLSLAMKKVKPN